MSQEGRSGRGHHRFDNGLVVEAGAITPPQRARYAKHNLHEPVEEAWIERLCRSGSRAPGGAPFRFWDVGAAIGYYSMLVARLRPDAEITAFEPLPSHYDRILQHWKLNGLDPARLRLEATAISDKAGSAGLLDMNFGSRLVRDPAAAPAAKRVEVRTESLDRFLAGSDSAVDLVKVDVQGGEDAVVAGAAHSAHLIRGWIVGTHGPRKHNTCVDRLEAMGYRIVFSEQDVDGQPDGMIVALQPDWPEP